MAKFHLAHTESINPAGVSPVLTHSQVWAGLQRKIRHAQEFVPVIESCEVFSDEDGVVDRYIKFAEGKGPKSGIRETVTVHGMTWVDFKQEDGSGTFVRNIISESGDGGDASLHMTYVFEYHYADIQPGSEEAAKKYAELKAMSKKAVVSSIEVIRQMVSDGRILNELRWSSEMPSAAVWDLLAKKTSHSSEQVGQPFSSTV